MTRWGLAFGLALVAAGAVATAPGLVLVGLLALFTTGVTELWTRYGLRDLHYERRIGRDRACGATKCRSTSPSGTTSRSLWPGCR